MSNKAQPLFERDIDALKVLAGKGRKWMPLAGIGGTSSSHHRNTIQKLIRHGLAEVSIVDKRGTKLIRFYRATAEGVKRAKAETK